MNNDKVILIVNYTYVRNGASNFDTPFLFCIKKEPAKMLAPKSPKDQNVIRLNQPVHS